MQQLTEEDLENMSIEDKINRMDEILGEIQKSRFHVSTEHFPFFHVLNLASTKVFQNHEHQTKLAWMCFEFLLQGEYLMTYYGIMNREVYDHSHQVFGWTLLKNHIAYNALTQAVITGSRIQFEQFMNFVYFALENKEIRKDNSGSKFTNFWKWIKRKGHMDDLFYLVPLLIACKKHDVFRTAEVHDGSKLKLDLFALKEPTVDSNQYMIISNFFLDFFESFLPILDYQRPKNMKYVAIPDFELDFMDWTQSYFDKDEKKLDNYMRYFEKHLK